jgi:hypothetical protein
VVVATRHATGSSPRRTCAAYVFCHGSSLLHCIAALVLRAPQFRYVLHHARTCRKLLEVATTRIRVAAGGGLVAASRMLYRDRPTRAPQSVAAADALDSIVACDGLNQVQRRAEACWTSSTDSSSWTATSARFLAKPGWPVVALSLLPESRNPRDGDRGSCAPPAFMSNAAGISRPSTTSLHQLDCKCPSPTRMPPTIGREVLPFTCICRRRNRFIKWQVCTSTRS